MKQNRNIIGADIAKLSIELYCYKTKSSISIENNEKGYSQFLKWIKEQKLLQKDIFVVMEHTGLYNYCFENFLFKKEISYHITNALNIKMSLGITRGKSDKLDAMRIARFGHDKKLVLENSPTTSKSIKRLQMLQSTRDRLVKQCAGLKNAVKEYEHIQIPQKDIILKSQYRIIVVMGQQIKKIEEEIEKLIATNELLATNYKLLTSIKGVGPVLATETIIKTRNFTKFADSRKFSCYCGTAPFEHSSGTSIRGKTRVSSLADKGMKKLLTTASFTAIQYNPEMKKYYERRIKSGKSPMSTINIIRNKIIGRMFAVIKRQTPYVEIYQNVA